MILQDSINQLIKSYSGNSPLYIRNVIKEELQNYMLNFVFTVKKFNQLIFTGGTCLRKVYGINRLSEDLDFDYVGTFDIEIFAQAVQQYFISTIQYREISYSISGNKKTVYFRFPILKELDLYSKGTPEDIFVRCDVSKDDRGGGTLDKNMIVAGSYQFFVTSYDLPTLFANKLVAFQERIFYKGDMQKIPFKGRDVYDVYWLTQLSGRSGYTLRPSTPRLQALLPGQSITLIKDQFCEKLKRIDTQFLYEDLFPLIESKEILNSFIDSYKDYLPKYIGMVLNEGKAHNTDRT